MGKRRPLDFRSFDEMMTDIHRLEGGDYDAAGRWDLHRACDHLAHFVEGSTDGSPHKIPWVVRFLIGRRMKKKLLRERRFKEGGMTPYAMPPGERLDPAPAVARLKRSVERFLDPNTQLHHSPLFGKMTRPEWEQIHLIHAAHHLSFLLPKEKENKPA